MDFETELAQLAKEYQDEGYTVILHPAGDQLPPFAQDFGVDIVATKGDERVLVQVKQDRSAVEADPNAPLRADITSRHPGWRYDLVVLRKDNAVRRAVRGAEERSVEQIERLLADAERLVQEGRSEPACVLAWAALEATMRRNVPPSAREPAWAIQPRALLGQIGSLGLIARDEYDELDQAWKLRSEIVHGFMPVDAGATLVPTTIRVARSLLALQRDLQSAAG